GRRKSRKIAERISPQNDVAAVPNSKLRGAIHPAVEALEGRLLLWGTPFLGAPVQLPAMIEAENFDNGAEGTAYHDRSSNNEGLVYRNTGVDVERTDDPLGGGYEVFSIRPGEWTTYTVNAPSTGTYNLDFRINSNAAQSIFHIETEDFANISGSVTIPNTANAWQTISKNVVFLTAGPHLLRIVFDYSTANIIGKMNWFRVAPAAPATPFV